MGRCKGDSILMELTLKEKLDYIWNRPGVLHPNHLNRFYWDVYIKNYIV